MSDRDLTTVAMWLFLGMGLALFVGWVLGIGAVVLLFGLAGLVWFGLEGLQAAQDAEDEADEMWGGG